MTLYFPRDCWSGSLVIPKPTSTAEHDAQDVATPSRGRNRADYPLANVPCRRRALHHPRAHARQAGSAPHPQGHRCFDRRPATERRRTLVRYPNLWRIRVGDYRVVSTVKDAELVVLALRVAPRSTVYRNL
jgi:mRNA-degrading endonuclease RelE of RelBE toxin-antitoxin system